MSENDIRTEGAASDFPIRAERGPLPLVRVPSGLSSSLRTLSKVNEHAAAAVLILLFLFNSWLLNLVIHADWLPIVLNELKWLAAPQLNVPEIHPSLSGLLAVIQVFLIGTLANMILLPTERDRGLKRVTAIGLGLGVVGWTTMLLSILGRLDRITINLAVFLLICILVYLGFAKRRFIARQFLSDFRNAFAAWAIGKPHFDFGACAFFGSLIALAGIEYYHATTAPVLHWDALVYHATMAKLIFQEHGIPLIAGPSVGIEMSGNYPPLYPSLGAFFYTQVGAIDDIYLRLISPTAGLLTAFIVYKTASQLGSRLFARAAALLLALAPLFITAAIASISYMLASFFFAATLFFLIRAMSDDGIENWACAGIAYGLGFATTYQAYFLLPAFVAALIIAIWRVKAGQRFQTIAHSLVALGLMLGVGGIWYWRNFVVVGDPIFPFLPGVFHGMNIDAALLQRSIEGIRADSLYNFFGKFDPSPLDLPRFILLNKNHFPAISIITVLGIAMAIWQANRPVWLIVLAFSLVPLGIVSSTVANIFPRYFIFALPGFALISALAIEKAMEWSGTHITIPKRTRVPQPLRTVRSAARQRNPFVIGLIVTFFSATAFFPSSLAAISGAAYQEADWAAPFDPLRLLPQPGQDQWQVLASFYGTEPRMWQWLNQHLADAQVATFENKIYYIKDADTSAFFYLDGWEARELYAITNPAEMVQYLSQHNVTYILDPSWIRHWAMYNQLPMNRYLGVPQYFPLVEGMPSDSAIYHVGPIQSPITSRSSLAVSFQPFDLSTSADGLVTSWRIPSQSESPRLFVQTPVNAKEISIEIDYTATGNGTLTVNRRTPIGWVYGEATGELKGAQQRQTLRFTIPVDKEHSYVELGLYSASADTIVTGIRASAQP